jgi:hypothetical protein
MPDHLECNVLDPVERAVEFAVALTEKTTLVQLSPDSMATAARYGSLVKLLGVVPHVRTVRTASVLTAVQIVWFSHHAARGTSSINHQNRTPRLRHQAKHDHRRRFLARRPPGSLDLIHGRSVAY